MEAIVQILPQRSLELLGLITRFYERIIDSHDVNIDNFAKATLYTLIRPEKEAKFRNEDVIKTFISV